MENDDRCYCGGTGSCSYCNENYFKDFHNLLVYPTFDGPNKPITAFNDFDLKLEFTHILEVHYCLATMYKNNLNKTGKQGYNHRLYLYEKGNPIGVVFLWDTHEFMDWRSRVNYVLQNYFD